MRTIPTRAWLVGLFAFSAFGGCADLSEMEEGTCGNGVVEFEAGEDCDLFPSETCIAPGERNECRISCEADDNDVRPACPVGWGCGSDDLCRQPSGTFDEEDWFPFDDTPKFAVGDVDADGRTDLVSVTLEELVVSFFDSDANVAQSVRRYSTATAPVVGQLTSDESPIDVVLLVDGMTVLVGSRDRSLRPTAYAPFALRSPVAKMVVMEAMPHGVVENDPGKWVGEEIIILSKGWASYTGMLEGDALLQVGDEDWSFAGDPATAKLDPTWPCEDVILSLEGEDSLTRFNPCLSSGESITWNHGATNEPIGLPSGTTAATGALVADINDDGLLDVMVGVVNEASSEPKPVVAYAVGDGTFNSEPPSDPPTTSDNKVGDFAFTKNAPGYERAENPPMPLAVSDVNNDGHADFVMPTAILVSIAPWDSDSSGDFQYAVLASPSSYPWDEGVIADFNANDKLDVVVASSYETGLTFYNGTGTGLFNEYWLATTGYPAHFAVGDFDGDLVLDLAFAETELESGDDTDTDPGDALSVVFGSGYGGPSEPVTMGHLGRIEQIDAGSMADFHQDDIDDLAVVARPVDDPDGNLSAAALGGSSNRQLLSPFVLSLERENEAPLEMTPWLVSVGEFDGDTNHSDFAVIGIVPKEELTGLSALFQADVRLWSVPSTGEALIDSTLDRPSDPFPDGFIGSQAAMASIDLTGDGIDEVAVFGPASDGSSLYGVVGIASFNGFAFSLEVVGEGPGVYWQALAGVPVEFGMHRLTNPVGPPDIELMGKSIGTHVAVGDVEGDEQDEIVVVAFQPDWENLTVSSHLQLVRQDGQGGLDVAGIVNLTEGVVDDPTAMTLVNLDTDPQLELVFVTTEAAYRADVQNGALANLVRLDGVAGGYSVAAADFSGDGIVDLAVGDYGVTTYKGNAVNP